MRMRFVSFWLATVVAITNIPSDATGAPAGGEEAVRKAAQAYADAFNSGNLDAVLALWTDDADYVDDLGNSYNGKAAITKVVKENLANEKRGKLKVATNAVRFPTDNVAIEDGTLHVTSATNTTQSIKYTAVWVNKDGKWLLSSVHDVPAPASTADAPNPKLMSLAWMVGEWTTSDAPLPVEVTCEWTLGEKFLRIHFHVEQPDGGKLAVEQIVGWDPISSEVRSWVFDSHGGFGEGAWSRDGNTWAITAMGVLPTGQQGYATNMLTYLDDNAFTFESTARQVAGQPVPDTKLKFTKKSAK